jgi:glycosyltransferase involved in cell wall biosynthesis
VVAADIPVMHEVLGTSAAFFDPFSETSIGDVLLHVLDDPAERARLVLAGSTNVRRFSWERAARETLGVYGAVFAEARR